MMAGQWKFFLWAAVASLVVGVLFVPGPVPAHDEEKATGKPAGIKLGGLLYDKWYEVQGVEVVGNHPLYPAGGKKSGPDTWRCKECHGWDYIGKDGRYGKGSHYTGIEGIAAAARKDAAELERSLTGGVEGHDFGALMGDAGNVAALVEFIREGLVDVGKAIDEQGRASGSAVSGKALYRKSCASCHGEDGNAIDFDDNVEGVQGVGWLANDNPQETLHKIRWGQPGSGMPSAVADGGLTDAETIDILTYSQGLE